MKPYFAFCPPGKSDNCLNKLQQAGSAFVKLSPARGWTRAAFHVVMCACTSAVVCPFWSGNFSVEEKLYKTILIGAIHARPLSGDRQDGIVLSWTTAGNFNLHWDGYSAFTYTSQRSDNKATWMWVAAWLDLFLLLRVSKCHLGLTPWEKRQGCPKCLSSAFLKQPCVAKESQACSKVRRSLLGLILLWERMCVWASLYTSDTQVIFSDGNMNAPGIVAEIKLEWSLHWFVFHAIS